MGAADGDHKQPEAGPEQAAAEASSPGADAKPGARSGGGTPAKRRRRLPPEHFVRLSILVIAAVQIALGCWALLAPGSFYETLASYPPRNTHFVQAMAAYPIAIGAALVIAGLRRTWRPPLLLVATLGLIVSAIAALINIGATDPDWLGYVNFIVLVVVTVFFIYLTGYSAGAKAFTRKDGQGKPPPAQGADRTTKTL